MTHGFACLIQAFLTKGINLFFSFPTGQEDRFSAFRERKTQIEKDVFRTDRFVLLTLIGPEAIFLVVFDPSMNEQ